MCDHRLEFLLKLTDITDGMTNSGNKGIQRLARDTGAAPYYMFAENLLIRPGIYWSVLICM